MSKSKEVQYVTRNCSGNVKDYSGKSRLTDYDFVQNTLNFMLGEVLTLMDASIPDKVQNKAIKDIIKGMFISKYVELSDVLFDKNCILEY
jgi:hypothetical protein